MHKETVVYTFFYKQLKELSKSTIQQATYYYTLTVQLFEIRDYCDVILGCYLQ